MQLKITNSVNGRRFVHQRSHKVQKQQYFTKLNNFKPQQTRRQILIRCQQEQQEQQQNSEETIDAEFKEVEGEGEEQQRFVQVENDTFYSEAMKQAYSSEDAVFSFEDDPLKRPLKGIELSDLPRSLNPDEINTMGQLVEEVHNSKSKRRTMLVGFTCNRCTGRSWRLVNPWAFSRGLVYVQCYYCESWHKLVDNLQQVEEIRFVHDDDVEETQQLITQQIQEIRTQIENSFQKDMEKWDELGEEGEDEEPLIVGQFVGDIQEDDLEGEDEKGEVLEDKQEKVDDQEDKKAIQEEEEEQKKENPDKPA